MPEPPARAVQYDFGPGTMASAMADTPTPLPPLALAEVDAPGLPEGSPAVLYRLAYADAQQLRPYAKARWSQPPAQLVQQTLRAQLGQRRAVLNAGEGAAQPRSNGKPPAVLRVELEEFSQIFTSPTESAAHLRLRATLAQPSPAGENLLGQRVFTAQRPAATADAAGGAKALAQVVRDVARDVEEWVEQVGR